MDDTTKYYWPISIVLAAALIAVALWQLSERNRFTITTGFSEANIPYLCDSKTGRVWRYFRNYDEGKKEFTLEGFTLLFDPENEK